MQETWVRSLVQEDPLEKEMATHSSILAWGIPWTESLMGYSPRGHKKSDTTEWLTLSLNGSAKTLKLTYVINIYMDHTWLCFILLRKLMFLQPCLPHYEVNGLSCNFFLFAAPRIMWELRILTKDQT